MPEQVDLIVRNGTLVSGEGRREADIAIRHGRFVAIASRGGLDAIPADEVDATGHYVLPGVIDGHVHFREPGMEDEEDWLSGSRAAVMGGITTVLDMPNTNPQTSSPDGARVKLRLAEEKSYCDFGFIGLLTSGNVDQLRPMAEEGLVVGFKAFLGATVGGIPAPDDGAILEGMREVRRLGMRLGFHAENGSIIEHEIRRLKAAGRTDPLAHIESRPAIAEAESILRMGLFARETGCPIHIFHLSSRPGLEMVDQWRAHRIDCTSEVTPHHCFLDARDMAAQGSVLKVNPPVRESGHGEVLLRALAEGRITCIATDHAPHGPRDKRNPDIWKAVSGLPGVETSVRLFLTYGVAAGRLTLEQFARATSEGPARTWGLWPRKGAIAVGSDADLTILDLEREGVIREAELHGKNNLNPFEGHRTQGAAVATIVRGQVQMRDGTLVGKPGHGRLQSPLAPAGVVP